MENKTYKFRYNSKSQKLAKWLAEVCKNFFAPIIICLITFFCMGATNTAKYIPSELGGLMFDISVIIGIVMVLIYSVLPKKVSLFSEHFEIVTGGILSKRKRPKIKINYSDIAGVCESTYNLKNDKVKMKNSFLAGDYTNYVELTLKGGKQFCFSVENQSECVYELNQRREQSTRERSLNQSGDASMNDKENT